MTNCISPIHKNNQIITNASNKKQNKSIISNNISRAINHKKCSSMKYIDSNSNSLYYENNCKNKYTVNKSFEERKNKKDKLIK